MDIKLLSEDKAHFYYNDLLEVLYSDNLDYNQALSRFKTILDLTFKVITGNEDIVFTSLFARINYVKTRYNIPSDLNENINELRKFINKVENKSIREVSDAQFATCTKVLSETICFFSNVEIPQEINKYFADKTNLIFVKTDQLEAFQKNIAEIVRCIIVAISDIKKDNNGKEYFWLKCIDSNDNNEFRVLVHNSSDYRNISNNLLMYHKLLWANSIVNFVRLIKREINNNSYFETKFDSLIIIEPDYLLDVTDIAECFGKYDNDYLFYFINKLSNDAPNKYAYMGKIVNSLLDKIITKNQGVEYFEENFDSIIKDIIEEDLLSACLFYENISEIKAEIKQVHLKNLIEVSERFNKNNMKVSIEPTFFSNIYGMQGRLDAMLQSNDNNYIDIFELKSGKPPEKGVWQSNKVQVACYNLLLQSTFGKEREGNSQILYSKALNNSLRNVESYSLLDNQLIGIRNQIVRSLFKLAVDDFTVIDEINNIKTPNACYYDFIWNKGFEMQRLYNSISETEKLYYKQMLGLIIREIQTAKTGAFDSEYTNNDKGFASFWKNSYLEKSRRYNILYDMTLQGASEQYEGAFEFSFNKDINHNFREGDIAILYSFNKTSYDNLKNQIIKGSILDIKKDSIIFIPKNLTIFNDKALLNHKWAIEHDLYETNYWSQIKLLYNFINANARFKDLIIKATTPQSHNITIERPDDLNDNQYELLCKAIQAKDYFLLQGPPGTGKTSKMLMRIVKQLIINECSNIVILAYTNRAIDEICKNLDKNNIPYIKTSGKEKTIDTLIDKKLADYGLLKNKLQSNKVFVSTIASFTTRINSLKLLLNFNTIIIDEASQITEANIVGILSFFKKFILIGDQNQMPPVILQNNQKTIVKNEVLIKHNIIDLQQSLFERLFQIAIEKNYVNAYGTLTTHYRMHQQTANLINVFYNNCLKEGDDTNNQTKSFDIFNTNSSNSIESMLATSRTIFIESELEKNSKIHKSEAVRIVKIIKTIKEKLSDNFTETSLGVITPWRAQIAEIKKHLQNENIDNITVDTVERFQGSEKDIIIVSLAIFVKEQLNQLQSLNFGKTIDRKMIVTLSRAKQQIIILGYKQVLVENKFYSELLEKIKENFGYINALQAKTIFKE